LKSPEARHRRKIKIIGRISVPLLFKLHTNFPLDLSRGNEKEERN
jgi:hypothetical protein